MNRQNEMRDTKNSSRHFAFRTTELKLSALILSEIPDAAVQILDNPNSIRKIIVLTFPKRYQDIVSALERSFIEKKAVANIYTYNMALNMLRSRLRESDDIIKDNRPRFYQPKG